MAIGPVPVPHVDKVRDTIEAGHEQISQGHVDNVCIWCVPHGLMSCKFILKMGWNLLSMRIQLTEDDQQQETIGQNGESNSHAKQRVPHDPETEIHLFFFAGLVTAIGKDGQKVGQVSLKLIITDAF